VGAAVSVASLALALAVAVLWIAGIVNRNGVAISKLGPHGFEVFCNGQQMTVWLYRGYPQWVPLRLATGNSSERHWGVPGYHYNGEGGSGGFAILGLIRFTGYTYYTRDDLPAFRATWAGYGMPPWLVVLAFLLYPMFWILVPRRRVRRRAKRRALGLCESCGYDLRGSADAGRCPECGSGFTDDQGRASGVVATAR
jgi:hypothetical protein